MSEQDWKRLLDGQESPMITSFVIKYKSSLYLKHQYIFTKLIFEISRFLCKFELLSKTKNPNEKISASLHPIQHPAVFL